MVSKLFCEGLKIILDMIHLVHWFWETFEVGAACGHTYKIIMSTRWKSFSKYIFSLKKWSEEIIWKNFHSYKLKNEKCRVYLK